MQRVCVCVLSGGGSYTGYSSSVVGHWTDLGHRLLKVSWGWFCKESPYCESVCVVSWKFKKPFRPTCFSCLLTLDVSFL